MFLTNTLDMLGMGFEDIDLSDHKDLTLKLSTGCAVFAQSEIVALIADNHSAEDIIKAVIWQIFIKAKPLAAKLEPGETIISGGLSRIKGIAGFVQEIIGCPCRTVENGTFLASIGCALV
jgi:activator of 2-hydroxyglutaryl-CoA dehydratase